MSSTALGIVLGSYSFLLTCLVTLIGVVYRNDQKQRERDRCTDQSERDKDREIIKEIQRHLDSNIKTQWLLIWRTNGLEDFLAEKMGYHPPRVIGEAEMFNRE